MNILNSSGLVVQIDEAVPTVPVGTWGSPSWVNGSVGPLRVSPLLASAVSNDSGAGSFDLRGRVLGVKGSVLISLLTGPQGFARTVGYLTDSLPSPANRIVVGLDALNRPYLSVKNYLGVEVALVTPSYPGITEGSQVTVMVSWDSTEALDGTRFAIFQVNRSAVPSGDWTTNPVAAWTHFVPVYAVLGFGVGGDSTFNGQVLSFQVSNDTVQGGAGAGGQFPVSHVFDRFLTDTVDATNTVATT